jgi:GTPase SAR1 family protein
MNSNNLLNLQNLPVLHEYNVLVFGQNHCGKSTFINRYTTGEYNNNFYNEINKTTSITTKGKVYFNYIENNTNYKYDFGLLMFDINNLTSETVQCLINDYHQFKKNNIDAKVILCAMKCDIKNVNDILYYKHIDMLKKVTKCEIYEISSKSNYNIDKPITVMQRMSNTKFMNCEPIHSNL